MRLKGEGCMVVFKKGHKNSKGEKAEWCIVSHETGKIISSHKSKTAAESHLDDIRKFKHMKEDTQTVSLNFKTYYEKETSVLNEDLSINDLITNYRKVFPYSDENKVNVTHWVVDGKDTNDMMAKGTVSSEEHPGERYNCIANFHREDTEKPFAMSDIGKVSCSCRAYRYNLSHPNTKNKAQSEPAPGYASIPNRIRNPQKNSGVCKHLFAFLHFLYNKGLIRNN